MPASTATALTPQQARAAALAHIAACPGHASRQEPRPDLVAPQTDDEAPRRYHSGVERKRLTFLDKPVVVQRTSEVAARYARIERSVSRVYTIFPYTQPPAMPEDFVAFHGPAGVQGEFKGRCDQLSYFGLRAFRTPSASGALPFVQPNGDRYWRTMIRYPEWVGDQIICVEDTVGTFRNKYAAHRYADHRLHIALAHAYKYLRFARAKGFVAMKDNGTLRLYQNAESIDLVKPLTRQQIIDLEHDYYDDCITVPRPDPKEQAIIDEHIRWNKAPRRESLARIVSKERIEELKKIADGILDRQVRAELAAEHAEIVRRASLTPEQIAQEIKDKELGDFLDSLDD